jgi:PIN domain nuclease of toxin-antitoxin system
MRVLLDTHTFLWFITADERLSTTAEQMIRDDGNEAMLSVASVWEMAIKVGQGRLPIPLPFDSFIPEQLSANRRAPPHRRSPHLRSRAPGALAP